MIIALSLVLLGVVLWAVVKGSVALRVVAVVVLAGFGAGMALFAFKAGEELAEARLQSDASDVICEDEAVEIALAHLKIDKVTEEPSQNFNLRVSLLPSSLESMIALLDSRYGRVTYADLSGLSETFEVYRIVIQHGLSGDSTVYITKVGGKVVLAQFLGE
ncbi:MAG: hypothetical protein ACYSX1_07095 [Planctomycetota bacterium]|jgi:hypothetical protein